MADALQGPVHGDGQSARYVLPRAYRGLYLTWVQHMQPDPASDVLFTEVTHGRTFTLRPAPACACTGPAMHLQRCGSGLPNLHVPAFGLKVWWYGAAWRGAWANKPLTFAQFRHVLATVARAERLKVLPQPAPNAYAEATA